MRWTILFLLFQLSFLPVFAEDAADLARPTKAVREPASVDLDQVLSESYQQRQGLEAPKKKWEPRTSGKAHFEKIENEEVSVKSGHNQLSAQTPDVKDENHGRRIPATSVDKKVKTLLDEVDTADKP